MKRISKQQEKQLAELTEELRENRQAVDDAFDELDSAVAEYNQTAVDLTELLTEVHGGIESHYNDRSERWQASEAGEAYQAWMEAWDQSVEEIDVRRPTFYEESDEIADLPSEPDLS